MVVFGVVVYCSVARGAVLYVAALGGVILPDLTLPVPALPTVVPIGATPAPPVATKESAGIVEAVVVGSLKEIVPAA